MDKQQPVFLDRVSFHQAYTNPWEAVAQMEYTTFASQHPYLAGTTISIIALTAGTFHDIGNTFYNAGAAIGKTIPGLIRLIGLVPYPIVGKWGEKIPVSYGLFAVVDHVKKVVGYIFLLAIPQILGSIVNPTYVLQLHVEWTVIPNYPEELKKKYLAKNISEAQVIKPSPLLPKSNATEEPKFEKKETPAPVQAETPQTAEVVTLKALEKTESSNTSVPQTMETLFPMPILVLSTEIENAVTLKTLEEKKAEPTPVPASVLEKSTEPVAMVPASTASEQTKVTPPPAPVEEEKPVKKVVIQVPSEQTKVEFQSPAPIKAAQSAPMEEPKTPKTEEFTPGEESDESPATTDGKPFPLMSGTPLATHQFFSPLVGSQRHFVTPRSGNLLEKTMPFTAGLAALTPSNDKGASKKSKKNHSGGKKTKWNVKQPTPFKPAAAPATPLSSEKSAPKDSPGLD